MPLKGSFTVYRSRPGRSVLVENLAGTTVINRPEIALPFIYACDHVEERTASLVDSLRMIEAAKEATH